MKFLRGPVSKISPDTFSRLEDTLLHFASSIVKKEITMPSKPLLSVMCSSFSYASLTRLPSDLKRSQY